MARRVELAHRLTKVGLGILELGGTQDTYADAEEIRDQLLRLIYGLWDHTKNHCEKERERAAKEEALAENERLKRLLADTSAPSGPGTR